jgi:hypothetical protein
MKRITLIITIALLLVLGAYFVYRPPISPSQAANLVPEVSKFGTLTNLKVDKGKLLFNKPIQEGFYVHYRVGDGKEQTFYAVGDRVSDPKASYSGYQEKMSGAGVTTQDGLNVTSGFIHDESKGTLRTIRTFVNRSKEKATIYLSEVKNYNDANLLPLRTIIGAAKKVEPLSAVIGAANRALPSRTGIDTEIEPNISTSNCWPCLPWPDCDLGTLTMDPMKATIICIGCETAVPGLVHVVCLGDLEKELEAYKAQGCDHPIKLIGIDGSNGRWDKTCPTVSSTEGKSTSKEVVPETRQAPSEEALKQLMTLPAGAAIVIITEHKVKMK